MKAAVFLGWGLVLTLLVTPVEAQERWEELKGNHFIVRYDSRISAGWASMVLTRAENYYDEIARQIGFIRYHDYWIWENRVPVYLYFDHFAFITATGLPEWSQGMAVRDERTASFRSIVSYYQERDFLEGLLPHEISHLILRDYLGSDRVIPVWLNEGVAQMLEPRKVKDVRRVMPAIVRSGRHIPFRWFFLYDIRGESDAKIVSVFYLQSLSMVLYLTELYGRQRFHQLLAELRDGRSFEESLTRIYYPEILSIGDFEKKWLNDITAR